MVGRPSGRSSSGRETIREIWRWSGTLREVQNWSRDPPIGPELVGTLSRIAGTGRQTVSKVWYWPADPPGGLELVGRPSQRSGTGRYTLPEFRY